MAAAYSSPHGPPGTKPSACCIAAGRSNGLAQAKLQWPSFTSCAVKRVSKQGGSKCLLTKLALKTFGREPSSTQCVRCGTFSVDYTDFKDNLARSEFAMSRFCQRCQDFMFAPGSPLVPFRGKTMSDAEFTKFAAENL